MPKQNYKKISSKNYKINNTKNSNKINSKNYSINNDNYIKYIINLGYCCGC